MSKRFSRSDFFLYLLVISVIVMILLTMYMIDRQWKVMSQVRTTIESQADDLRSLRDEMKFIRGKLQNGIRTTAVSPSEQGFGSSDSAPTFRRALSANNNEDYASGDWMVRAFGNSLKTITPLVSSDAYASQIQGFVLESLLSRDPQSMAWEPHIAQSWHVSEDGLVITFVLRDDVRFSDGEKLDAYDVQFSYDFIQNETIAAPRERAVMDKIKSVIATDERTVVFTFVGPYFNSLALAGGLSILPKHFYEKYLEDPETFNQSKGILLGSGPYQLSDPSGWTPDTGFVELQQNPRYWGPIQPPYKRIVWRIIENESARLTTFRNGDIDRYGEVYGARVRPKEYQSLLDDKDINQHARNYEYVSPSAGYSYIAWNQQRDGKSTRFADKRVRLAMTYLTDREGIIRDIMLGYAVPAMSPFRPNSEQHDKSLKLRAYNLDQALKLLSDAGYSDANGDGVLTNQQGELFEFELVYFQGNTDTRRIVLFLKDLYARAGIIMKPIAAEWSVMIDLIDKRNFDAITLGWSGGIETDIYQIFHSAQTSPGGDNFVNFKSKKLDKLIENARETVEEANRMALWRQAERIIYQEQPYTFLMRRKTLSFIDRRFHNLNNTNLGLNMDFVPIETYVPAAMQKYTN